MTPFDEIVLPGEPGKPVVLALHGTGGDEHDLIQISEAVAPGWTYWGIRGKESEHGMNRYFKRFAEGIFDEDDIRMRTPELAEWVRTRRQDEDLAGRPVVALGYSNGANMAANLLLSGSGVLEGAVMLRPMVTLDWPEASLNGVKGLVISGQIDPICPSEQGAALAGQLREAGAEVEFVTLGVAHNLAQGDIVKASEFLASFEG